jgi:hypothetical protein
MSGEAVRARVSAVPLVGSRRRAGLAHWEADGARGR